MRISDWSSDVCSSDLGAGRAVGEIALGEQQQEAALQAVCHRHRRVEGEGLLQAVAGRQLEAQVGLDRRIIGAERLCAGRRLWQCSDLVMHGRRSRVRSEEHTSELQSLMRNSYAVFCLKKKTILTN